MEFHLCPVFADSEQFKKIRYHKMMKVWIKTMKDGETTIPGIFAVGDVSADHR